MHYLFTNTMKKSFYFFAALCLSMSAQAQVSVATFDDITIGEDGHTSTADATLTSFRSGGYEFSYACNPAWASWHDFAYSNSSSNAYEDLSQQWNNIVGGGYGGSANYGVGYYSSWDGAAIVTITGSDEPVMVPGFYVTNSAYTYTSLMYGDSYSKKFDLGDWLILTITGYDAEGNTTGTKDYYLADLRDSEKAYIINDWRYVDLSSLGMVKKLAFTMNSSDVGQWGINTPTYFCFDNFGAEGTEELPIGNFTVGIRSVDSHAVFHSDDCYDLQGRRIVNGKSSMGRVVIVDGKKMMVR